jgi:hypothetical protein
LDREHEDERIVVNMGLNQILMYAEGSLIVDFCFTSVKRSDSNANQSEREIVTAERVMFLVT